jgi:chitinase
MILSLSQVCCNVKCIIAEKVVCYHGSWSAYRPGNGQFEIEYIDPKLCTHAIYTFVGIGNAGEVRILDNWNDVDKGK